MTANMTLAEAEQYLFDRIPTDNAGLFPGDIGFKRTVALMELLGNPQYDFPVIHVAGTSGKGSTSYMSSSILKAAGYKVGLNISPHVVSIRERIQIDNEMIPEDDFARIISELKPTIEEFSKGEYGAASYFDVIVAAAFVYFKEQKVDVAVVEVGLGGTLDGTNVVHSDIAIITPIGLDHEKILGSTIGQIAEQKAGIIKKTTKSVISAHQRPDAEKVIRWVAKEQGSPTIFLNQDFFVDEYRTHESGVQFNYTAEKTNEHVSVNLAGKHQAENAACSITATLALKKYFPTEFVKINFEAIKKGLSTVTVPGRFELFMYKGMKIILDGAHNPDKMTAFSKAVQDIYPNAAKYGLFGVKRGKNLSEMLSILTTVVNRLGITQFWKETDMGQKMGEDAEIVAEAARAAGVEILCVDGDCGSALEKVIHQAKTEQAINEVDHEAVIIVTGSLFLVSEIREYILR